jgi:hypothetical protein
VSDEIVEGVRSAETFDARGRVPEVRARNLMHLGAGGVVDQKSGLTGGFRGEEELRALADEGFAGLEIFGVEGGDDGVAKLRTVGFGEFDELRSGGFVGRGGVSLSGSEHYYEEKGG